MILAILLLQAAGPEYPTGRLRPPDLAPSGARLTLTDLSYQVTDEGGTAQALEFRVRLGNFAFLGGEITGQRRGVSLATHRLSLAYTKQQERHDVFLSWRAKRLLTEVSAARRAPGAGRGWTLDSDLALRLNPDLELIAHHTHDTDARNTEPLAGRVTRSGSLGLLVQRGSWLEASASYARSRVRTLGLIDSDRDLAFAGASLSRPDAEVSASLAWDASHGRLPRNQGLVEVDAAARLFGHLLLEASARDKWETGIGSFERRLGGGVTFFGRPQAFERSGRAATSSLALARRAWELGLNERRVHDVDRRRALRERLALSPRREELRELSDDLHAAEVAERNVPQAGFELARSFDDINGTSSWQQRLLLGVPWRPAWPWSRSDEAVEFVSVAYTRTATRFETGILAVDKSLVARAFLNRETSLRFTWSKLGQTPLDIIRLVAPQRRLQLECVYAFGR